MTGGSSRELAAGERPQLHRSQAQVARIAAKHHIEASEVIPPLLVLNLGQVGIGVSVGFGPLIGRGLLVEVVLRLHQRERLCEEGATAYRLVVPQTAVTAALLRAIRQGPCQISLDRLSHMTLEGELKDTRRSVKKEKEAPFRGFVINMGVNSIH
ncbi:hypothetical protein EYF80_027423 [Liparis tanakae]|uniref:Uncharacterized protein n=1 Tax=Liparis tanakae TaxID=230148 RepID=A0A4Z2HBH5_9TELE|nr:hypothetical protein EYF80_027423 [Liparis tanakae]